MLKAISLLLLTCLSAFAQEEHATISLQRWNEKIVVTVKHDDGWHTYWKNPGDAGIPNSFKFTQKGKPLTLKAYEWPAPERHIEAGDILTIGYEGTYHFFFDAVPGDLSAQVGVLICKDVCIPGEAKLNLPAKENFISSRKGGPYSADELQNAFEKLPKEATVPEGLEYYLTRKKGENLLTLHYSLKGAKSKELPHKLPFLTALPQAPWGYKRETLFYKDGTLYGRMEIEWDGEYQEPVLPLPENGQFPKAWDLKFLLNEAQVKVITLKVKDFSLASPALDDFYKKLDTPAAAETKQVSAGKSLLEYLFFAFLGGLILNLMPCVLPVISIKLFGLIRHRNVSRRQLLRHNLSYTAGVMFTFGILAMIVAAIKAGGEEIGWGFQLQSPAFILVMNIILFVMALNLFGLFEFATPGGRWLGGTETKEGVGGDFFSGVLSTILSTPCSAPFLGTALTFAFTSSISSIFLIFFAIGLGLAFPFLMTAFVPQTLQLLPKPGAWMEKLKYFLGLSLLLTLIWLNDVFVGLVEYDMLSLRVNLLFVLWFFAFFFSKKVTRNSFAQLLVFAFPIVFTVVTVKGIQMRMPMEEKMKQTSMWQSWSREKLVELKGKTVFMDFTAEWCLTCKVNKKLVMETPAFKNLAEKYKLELVRADWTRRDDNITMYLREHYAVGVPAYFVQKPDGTIISLGETLTIGKIEEAIR